MRVFIFFFCFFVSLTVFANHNIQSFQLIADINQDSTVSIHEKIKLEVTEQGLSTGFYRDLYIRKKFLNNSEGFSTIQFEGVQLNDEEIPLYVHDFGSFLRVYLVPKSKQLKPGVYHFDLLYSYGSGIIPLDDVDKFSLNFLGRGFSLPIKSLYFDFFFPENVRVLDKKASVFSGSTQQSLKLHEEVQRLYFFDSNGLNQNQKIGVEFGFEKGFFNFSQLQTFFQFLNYHRVYNPQIFFVCVSIFLLYLYTFFAWLFLGHIRRRRRKMIRPLCYPIEVITPLEVDFLVNYGQIKNPFLHFLNLINLGVVSVNIFDNKNLHVRPVSRRHIKFLAEKYAEDYEVAFYTDCGNDFVLKKEYSKYFDTYMRGLEKHIASQVKYLCNLNQERVDFCSYVAFLLTVYSFFIEFLPGFYLAGFYFLLKGFFAFLLFKPTPYGLEVLRDLEGIKRFLEAKRLPRVQKPTIEDMERLFPFAIILNLHQEWSNKMIMLFGGDVMKNYKNHRSYLFVNRSMRHARRLLPARGGINWVRLKFFMRRYIYRAKLFLNRVLPWF